MKLIMEIVNIHVTFFDVSGQDYGSGGGFYSINIIKGQLAGAAEQMQKCDEQIQKIKDRTQVIKQRIEEENPDDDAQQIQVMVKQDDDFMKIQGEYKSIKEEKSKKQEIVEFFETYLNFLTLVDSVVSTLKMLLGSEKQTDILESIYLLTRLQELKIERAVEGTQKILVLFFNKDDLIKKAALDSYQSLYLKPETPLEVRARALIELLKEADTSEEACVEEFLSTAVKEKAVNTDMYAELWKIFSKS